MAVPYSRDSMRGLRNAMDEKFRVAGVNRIVNEIYSAAVHIARTTANSMYQHLIPRASIYPIPSNMRSANLTVRDPRNDDEKFYISNMYDILKGLRALFPECSVEYKMLTRGQDGKMYDITTIDEKMLPFINRAHDQAYVIVDWT
jgi:hypothetical protein